MTIKMKWNEGIKIKREEETHICQAVVSTLMTKVKLKQWLKYKQQQINVYIP